MTMVYWWQAWIIQIKFNWNRNIMIIFCIVVSIVSMTQKLDVVLLYAMRETFIEFLTSINLKFYHLVFVEIRREHSIVFCIVFLQELKFPFESNATGYHYISRWTTHSKLIKTPLIFHKSWAEYAIVNEFYLKKMQENVK